MCLPIILTLCDYMYVGKYVRPIEIKHICSDFICVIALLTIQTFSDCQSVG